MGMEKNGRRTFIWITMLLLVALTGMTTCGCSKAISGNETETELDSGQRKAQIRVISITGNELTYVEMEKNEGRKSGSKETENGMIYLPVGSIVHTDNGKQATFSILKTGDNLEVLFEADEAGEEMITEIWMLGEGDGHYG